MLLQGPVAYGVWRLLEELYFDSASEQGAREYAGLSETEKQTTLKDFARRQATISKRWSHILQNLLSADLEDWQHKP
jgi:hypothetical protein